MPTAVAPSAAATAQAAVPDYSQTGPLGAAMEGWAYPYPVQMLQFEHEGRLLRMAYMDVQPAKPNGQTVMLFHGKNFGADYWASTLQALSAQDYRVIAPDMSTMSPASVLAQVISTHGTPAYVHLALESQRRFCPDVAVLVVDDCSADGDPLTALCANHGVPLVRNPTRLGHQNGDLAAVAHGLRFASNCKADWLLKTSRRFIPLRFEVFDIFFNLATFSQKI